MSLPLVLTPEAEAELNGAVDWYERNTGRGLDFMGHVQQVLTRIGKIPLLHQVVYQDIRRGVLQKYPYSIFYRVEPTRVTVISVFNHHRDPSIWQSRV